MRSVSVQADVVAQHHEAEFLQQHECARRALGAGRDHDDIAVAQLVRAREAT
jgi:hypothetical protein